MCEYPAFYRESMHLDLPETEHVTLIRSKNWLTEALMNKLDDYSPKSIDITQSETSNEKALKQSSFEYVCKKLFFKGRQFVDHEQLEKYAEIFYWNVRKTISGSCIDCSYKKSKQKNGNNNDVKKRKKTMMTDSKIPLLVHL